MDFETLARQVRENRRRIEDALKLGQEGLARGGASTTTLQTQITSNDTDIANLQSDVATNTTNIATNTADIAAQVSQVTTNTNAIASNELRLDDCESSQVTEDWGAAGSLPGSPAEGRIAWHTASDQYCYYDSGRSRWLSFWKEDLSYADQVATAALGFLKIEAITTSALFGHTWPYDVCITGGRAICANPTTGTVVLFSASHPSGAASLAFGGARSVTSTAFNVLIPAGEVVSSVATAATAGATSAIWFARRIFT